jgi:hypothetical protein
LTSERLFALGFCLPRSKLFVAVSIMLAEIREKN